MRAEPALHNGPSNGGLRVLQKDISVSKQACTEFILIMALARPTTAEGRLRALDEQGAKRYLLRCATGMGTGLDFTLWPALRRLEHEGPNSRIPKGCSEVANAHTVANWAAA